MASSVCVLRYWDSYWEMACNQWRLEGQCRNLGEECEGEKNSVGSLNLYLP